MIDFLYHVARRKFGALTFWGTQYSKTPYPKHFCFLDGYSFHAFDVLGGYSFHAFVALGIFSISISRTLGYYVSFWRLLCACFSLGFYILF